MSNIKQNEAKFSFDEKNTYGKRPKGRSVKPLAKLFPFIIKYRRKVLYAFVFLVLTAVITLIIPIAIRKVIDDSMTGGDSKNINTYFIVMLGFVFMYAISSALRYYYVIWIGERVVADMRKAVFNHLTNLSMSFFEITMTGEVLSRLTADTTQIKSAFGASASIALRNMFLLIGSIIMMIVSSPRLSSMVLIAIPALVIPLVLFGRRVRKLSRRAQDTLANTAAFATETILAIRTVQSFNHESHNRNIFNEATEKSFAAAERRTSARALLASCIVFAAVASIVIVLWIGSSDVINGRISSGQLGQFILYSAFAAAALSALSQVWGEVQSAAGAAERIAELLEVTPEISTPKSPIKMDKEIKGEIILKNINFNYPTRPNVKALHNLTITINPGETVAIVGASGSGKTTIFNLLLRFYDPQSGGVFIDGINIKDVAPKEVRSKIALVPQEPMIFSDNIINNISYGKYNAKIEEIKQIAKAAMVDEFVTELPDGYDSRLGERGINLSGGQKQRIAIARALLKNAPILLLDEATSSLDSESENLVQKALDKLMRNRTTLIIAHRLSTVKNADRILVLDHGNIVAQGTHDNLINQDGIYAKLAKLQFTQ